MALRISCPGHPCRSGFGNAVEKKCLPASSSFRSSSLEKKFIFREGKRLSQVQDDGHSVYFGSAGTGFGFAIVDWKTRSRAFSIP